MSSEPVRSCIGCRTRRRVTALVRITRGADGIVVDGPSAGRGAWLCRTPDGVSAACFDEALRRRAFARAWRCEVGAHELAVVRMATIEGTHDGAEPAPSA